MPEVVVRKKLTCVEEIFHEGGPVAERPLRRAAAIAVIRNPFAGSYVANIEGFMDDLKPLGLEMARISGRGAGRRPKVVEGYGKGAIVGSAGELEHGALWHVPGGYAMREVLGGAKAIVASTKKVGGPERGSMCRSRTSMPRTCAAISTRWKSASTMRRVPTRFCWLWS